MKIKIISLIIGIMVLTLGLGARSAFATFNICQIAPWLPQCQDEPGHECENGIHLYNPHCYVSPTPSPSVSPSPTPNECEQWCESPSPTPEVSPTPEPTQASSGDVTTPSCPNGNTAKVPAWPHVTRSGEQAVVNAFITEGDNAQIYWKVVGQNNWQYSSAQSNPDGVKPNGDKWIDFTVHGLDANLGYTFGISQHSGCGGGEIVTAVIIDGPQSETFAVSYYELK